MIKPVNRNILVKIVALDPYRKSKSGIILPNASITTANGTAIEKQIFVVVSKASDCNLDVKEGDKLELSTSRIEYFLDDNEEKVALIKEDLVTAIVE